MRASASREPNRRPAASSWYCAGYSALSADAISRPTRTGRSATRSVTMMKTPWHSWFGVLARRRREPDGIEADARDGRARSARRRAARRRSTARRRARTACRCRGRPTGSCPRSRRCPDRAPPRSGCACWATGLIQGSAGVVEPVVAPPVLHRDDGQVRADLVLGVEQLRQLADASCRGGSASPGSSRRSWPRPCRARAPRSASRSPGSADRARTPAASASPPPPSRTPSSSCRCRSARRCPAGRSTIASSPSSIAAVGRRVSP